jgi:hypothetical protein
VPGAGELARLHIGVVRIEFFVDRGRGVAAAGLREQA